MVRLCHSRRVSLAESLELNSAQVSRLRRISFWAFLISLTVVAAVAAGEGLASFVVPPYPMRLLRPYPIKPGLQVESSQENEGTPANPELIPFINSWGLRDRERSIERPSTIRFRSIFVGDSFLEGHQTRASISGRVEEIWAKNGDTTAEAINLGISATGPAQYFYRIKRFGLDLKPDLVLVMFYAGNDFVYERLGDEVVPPFIRELPEPSLLGAVAPRLTWFSVDRLRVAEAARNVKPIPNEFENLRNWTDLPPAERTDRLVAHMRRFYYPNLDEGVLREVLGRGDNSFWATFRRNSQDRQYLSGPFLYSLIDWETGSWPVPSNPIEALQDQHLDLKRIDATFTWLVGMRRQVESRGARFVVAMAPTGVVDPDYVEAWKAWPRYFSFSVSSDARHQRFVSKLRAEKFNVIDLREDLNDVTGTYRIGDGHWNERGHAIVAMRIARELANR